MKKVSLYELKKHLSSLVEEASSGERILITRYRRPVAELGSTRQGGLHVGARFGSGLAGPLFTRKTGGRFLEVLEEDREAGSG